MEGYERRISHGQEQKLRCVQQGKRSPSWDAPWEYFVQRFYPRDYTRSGWFPWEIAGVKVDDHLGCEDHIVLAVNASGSLSKTFTSYVGNI